MPIGTFYTYFWILYFPLCIAFYDKAWIPTWVDEAMTLGLILYTGFRFGDIRQKKAKNEIWAYLSIMLFYLVYSLITAVNVRASVYLDLQQQIRPYAVFYCTWLLAPRFTRKQLKWILWSMYATIILYIPTALGRAEDIIIGQLCMNCAMIYYLFKPETRKNILIAIGVATLGLLSMKSKYFGEYIVFIALFYFVKKRIKVTSLKAGVYLILLAAVIIFFTWFKFEEYFVSGWEREGTARMARPETYKVAWKIIFSDYIPFGSGLGSFATNAAAEYYSPLYFKYGLDSVWGLTPDRPMFLADAYYPTLAEYGLAGMFLFIVFWKRRLFKIQNLADMKYYKVGMMAFFALALESVADTSYLSGKGMGYFMLLGLVMNAPNKMKYISENKGKPILKEDFKKETRVNGDNYYSSVT